MSNRWVYRFDELDAAEAAVGGDWERARALLGGKGANLADMVRAGVPVPAGFTVTTEACNAYLAAGHFRSGLYLSPATAMVMSELLCGIAPQIDLAPFRVGR